MLNILQTVLKYKFVLERIEDGEMNRYGMDADMESKFYTENVEKIKTDWKIKL